MLKRVSITGPESCGKTWLTKKLAAHYKTHFVEEYSREYLEINGVDYVMEDVINIAKGQLERESQMAEKCENFLFCDTDLLVNKIWCEVVYGKCPDWIEDQFNNHIYDLYLLCFPDIPWEPDPLREYPEGRDMLFELYETALIKKGLPFKIVKGLGEERLKNAITFVSEMIQ
jgi:NadR type nicotinamide-nucleotide adenylyltransferase